MSETRIARSLDEVPAAPSVVTIGHFDGVHKGHRTLLGRTRSYAEEHGLRSVVVTFDRHPMEVLRPGSQPRYLQHLDHKIAALLAEGIDLVYVIPFTYELSQRPAEWFIERQLAGPVTARRVIVGVNFRFGHGARGDIVMLAEEGERHGFETEAVSLLDYQETPISSTEIRDRIALGEVEWAAHALGRPHILEGAVVKGDARGRLIGFPTANVEIDDRMQMPANGVYAGHAVVLGADGRVWPMVVNVGRRPTFGGERLSVEAHLFDCDLDLYGEHLAVSFEHRLRDEVRFPGVDELVAQIGRDVELAKQLLAETPVRLGGGV